MNGQATDPMDLYGRPCNVCPTGATCFGDVSLPFPKDGELSLKKNKTAQCEHAQLNHVKLCES